MKKRMFSLIIVLSMLIVGIPMIAHAETSGNVAIINGHLMIMVQTISGTGYDKL